MMGFNTYSACGPMVHLDAAVSVSYWLRLDLELQPNPEDQYRERVERRSKVPLYRE